MTPQHILVPIDFSAYADLALEHAIALAGKLQARLTLLHVILALPLGVVDRAVGFFPLDIADLEAKVQQSLEPYRQRVHEAGLEADIVLVYGIPFQSIIDIARDRQVDLIVMSTHGRTGLQYVLLGSVAEKVMRLAPCPVLVTRGTAIAPGQ